jgi:hypothetical protein
MAQAVSRRHLTAEARVDPASVRVGFVVDKVALGQVFLRVLRFSLSASFHRCFITWKNEKQNLIIIFVTMLHNKSEGCGASVQSAAGPFTTKENCNIYFKIKW